MLWIILQFGGQLGKLLSERVESVCCRHFVVQRAVEDLILKMNCKESVMFDETMVLNTLNAAYV